MASRYVQEMWKGKVKAGTCVEGKTLYLDMGEPVENFIERYAGALRSGLTYSGSKNIKDFQKKCEFILLK
jgi:IMP dehydrogenase/GMP reductase